MLRNKRSEAQTSALATLAASIPRSEWRELSTSNINPTLSANGASGTIFGFTEYIKWDPASRRLIYLGGDHSDAPRFVSYSEASNSWQTLPYPPWLSSNPADWVGQAFHGYDHGAMDPKHRFFYIKRGPALYRYQLDSGVWTKMSDNNVIGYDQNCCVGIDYFPEMQGVVWASVESGNRGGITILRDTTGQWEHLGRAATYVMGAYHHFAEYNPIHKVVLFGAGNSSGADENRKIYKLDSSGTVTPLHDAPVGLGIQQSIVTVDPISGEYLVFANNKQFYTYDVVSDTWRLQPGTVPIWTTMYENAVHGVVAGPVSTYGINVFVTCNGSKKCRVWLYKHAPGIGASVDATPPSVPSNLVGSVISSSQINLSWTESTDNAGMIGYKIFRNGMQIATTNQTSYQSIGLSASTTYTFAVAAYDAAGDTSAQSNAVSATTLTPEETLVSITAPTAGSTVNGTSVIISASASGNLAVAGVQFQLDGVNLGPEETTAPYSVIWNTTQSSNDTHVLAAVVRNADGNTSIAADITVRVNNNVAPTSADSINGYPMPSVEDEKNTYRSWGWTWSSTIEPYYPSAHGYAVSDPDIHGDTEGDDLWSYLMAYVRTGQQGYLDRAAAWVRYFKQDYRACIGNTYSTFCADRSGFGADHLYGWGLLAWSRFANDAAALTEAEQLGGVIGELWAPTSDFSCLRSGGCMWYGFRQASRHLLLTTRLAEVTGDSRWATLRDQIFNTMVNSMWDSTYGMYFYGDAQTDYYLGAGAYASGSRIFSSFHIAVLAEAYFRYWRVTHNATARDHIIAMANYFDHYGLDPTYQYTGDVLGIVNREPWFHAVADPVYTTEMSNLFVMAYKFTGNTHYLDRAKYFFNRGTKGVYGNVTARHSADTVVDHFIDTQFDSSSRDFYLGWNKGELLYTYLIFENGGTPTLETSDR